MRKGRGDQKVKKRIELKIEGVSIGYLLVFYVSFYMFIEIQVLREILQQEVYKILKHLRALKNK